MKKTLINCIVLLAVFSLMVTCVYGADKKTKLTVYTQYVESDKNMDVQGFREAVKQYAAENPDVDLNVVIVAPDVYIPKLQTQAAADDLPDLFEALPPMQQSFYDNNLIMPLNGILDANPTWKNSFIDGAFDDHTYGGKILAMPYVSLFSHVLFYNKDIFQKCGITKFPSTLDEFKDAVVKIKAKGYIPLACGNKSKDPLASTIMPGLVFRYLDTNWYSSVRENKGAKFTDPEYVKAIDKLGELIKLGLFNSDLNSIDNNQARLTYYNTGKAAMYIWGTWILSSMIADCPKAVLNQTEFAMLPPQAGRKDLANLIPGGTGWGWAINSKLTGKKLEAAVKFYKKMTSPKIQEKILAGGMLVVNKVKLTNTSKLDPFYAKFLKFKDTVKLVPCPEIQLPSLYLDASYTGYQNFSVGGVTSEDLAKQLQKAMDDSRKK